MSVGLIVLAIMHQAFQNHNHMPRDYDGHVVPSIFQDLEFTNPIESHLTFLFHREQGYATITIGLSEEEALNDGVVYLGPNRPAAVLMRYPTPLKPQALDTQILQQKVVRQTVDLKTKVLKYLVSHVKAITIPGAEMNPDVRYMCDRMRITILDQAFSKRRKCDGTPPMYQPMLRRNLEGLVTFKSIA